MTSKRQRPAGLVGVGYEGRTVEELIAQLHVLGVSRLVDVRLTPLSRKPGLSKTALEQALGQAGIVYEHRRELGNPKGNRPGFASTGTARDGARAHYSAYPSRLTWSPRSRQEIHQIRS